MMRTDEPGDNGGNKPLQYALRFSLGILIETAVVGLLMGIAFFISSAGF
jgi:hypothetical protein